MEVPDLNPSEMLSLTISLPLECSSFSRIVTVANVHNEVSVESTGLWPLTWYVATCGSHCAHKDTRKLKDTRKHIDTGKHKDTGKHQSTKKHKDTRKHKYTRKHKDTETGKNRDIKYTNTETEKQKRHTYTNQVESAGQLLQYLGPKSTTCVC